MLNLRVNVLIDVRCSTKEIEANLSNVEMQKVSTIVGIACHCAVRRNATMVLIT